MEKVDENSFFIEKVNMFSIDKTPLYLNYNINGQRIDGLVENDGIPGMKFIVNFEFPSGKSPILITPDTK
ncbi:MAG TPA: hypothetical protein PKD85_16165, partial [Saprospiraceae bacterium]|nr:hypothetical protein [Saprospiraceae bacterium]